MGIIKRLFSGEVRKVDADFHNKPSIIGYIQMCEDLYAQFQVIFPNKDPHEILVGIYNLILTQAGKTSEHELLNNPDKSWEILLITLWPACVPTQYCARALAYELILQDDALSMEFLTNDEYRKYSDEYSKILRPLHKIQGDKLRDIYSQYNKNTHNQAKLFS